MIALAVLVAPLALFGLTKRASPISASTTRHRTEEAAGFCSKVTRTTIEPY